MNEIQTQNRNIARVSPFKSILLGWSIIIIPILYVLFDEGRYIWSIERLSRNTGLLFRNPILSFAILNGLIVYYIVFNIRLIALKGVILRIYRDRVIYYGKDIGNKNEYFFSSASWRRPFETILEIKSSTGRTITIPSNFVCGSKAEILESVVKIGEKINPKKLQ